MAVRLLLLSSCSWQICVAQECLTLYVSSSLVGTHYYTSQRACIEALRTQAHNSSDKTAYPRGSRCHISHYIKPCEAHFVWSCYGYLLDPAGYRFYICVLFYLYILILYYDIFQYCQKRMLIMHRAGAVNYIPYESHTTYDLFPCLCSHLYPVNPSLFPFSGQVVPTCSRRQN